MLEHAGRGTLVFEIGSLKVYKNKLKHAPAKCVSSERLVITHVEGAVAIQWHDGRGVVLVATGYVPVTCPLRPIGSLGQHSKRTP